MARKRTDSDLSKTPRVTRSSKRKSSISSQEPKEDTLKDEDSTTLAPIEEQNETYKSPPMVARRTRSQRSALKAKRDAAKQTKKEVQEEKEESMKDNDYKITPVAEVATPTKDEDAEAPNPDPTPTLNPTDAPHSDEIKTPKESKSSKNVDTSEKSSEKRRKRSKSESSKESSDPVASTKEDKEDVSATPTPKSTDVSLSEDAKNDIDNMPKESISSKKADTPTKSSTDTPISKDVKNGTNDGTPKESISSKNVDTPAKSSKSESSKESSAAVAASTKDNEKDVSATPTPTPKSTDVSLSEDAKNNANDTTKESESSKKVDTTPTKSPRKRRNRSKSVSSKEDAVTKDDEKDVSVTPTTKSADESLSEEVKNDTNDTPSKESSAPVASTKDDEKNISATPTKSTDTSISGDVKNETNDTPKESESSKKVDTTPTKSSKKKRTRSKSKSSKEDAVTKDDEKDVSATHTKSTDTSISGDVKNDANDTPKESESSKKVDTTPTKSSKKRRTRSKSKSSKEDAVTKDDEKDVSATPAPISTVTSISGDVKNDANDTPKESESSKKVDTTPTKSSKKKRTRSKSSSSKEGAEDVKNNTDDTTKESESSNKVDTTPTKSSKKKRTRSKSSSSKEGTITTTTPTATPTKSVPDSMDNPGRSTRKRQKKSKSKADTDAATTATTPPPKPSNNNRNELPSPPLPGLPTPTKPNVHVNVQRFRSTNYIPTTILRMCPTPTPISDHDAKMADSYVAISRQGGQVELVCPNEQWRCVVRVEGLPSRDVDSLVWICGSGSSNNTPNTLDGTTSSSPPTTSLTTTTPGSMENDENITYFFKQHECTQEIQFQRRLFGASRDGTIFEIDLKSKSHVGVVTSGGGAVYCLATLLPPTQPTTTSREDGKIQTVLAAGCEDGCVRLYRIKDREDGDDPSLSSLDLISTLPSTGTAITSLVWKRGTDIDGIGGSTIYAAAGDGTIRRFDCKSSTSNKKVSSSSISTTPHASSTGLVLGTTYKWISTSRITLGNQGGTKATVVWSLKLLTDETLISADSMGMVNFWDGMGGTLLQSFEHNSLNMDVLDIEVNQDETTLMATGIDPTVIFIQRAKGDHKWNITTKRKPHSHDVNTLAIVHVRDPDTEASKEILCSGGVDTRVYAYDIADIRQNRPTLAYKYPADLPISFARQSRILAVMKSTTIDFYQMEQNNPEIVKEAVQYDETDIYIGCLEYNSTHSLSCFDVSDDGRYLALSEARDGLTLYALDIVSNGEKKELKYEKIQIPAGAANLSCSKVKFTNDSRLICATPNGPIAVLQIQAENKVDLEHMFDNRIPISSSASTFPVSQLTVSPDSKWFAVSRNTLNQGSIKVFSLSPGNYQHWWSLPSFRSPHSSIRFSDTGDDTRPSLVVTCYNNEFYIFNVREKSLDEWSEPKGFPVDINLPWELRHQVSNNERSFFNPSYPHMLFMGGADWFCAINLKDQIPTRSKPFPSDHLKARPWKHKIKRHQRIKNKPTRKRKKKKDDEVEIWNDNYKICLQYTRIIFMDFISKDEMLVVEQPWSEIMDQLSNPVIRHRYGSY